jgi:hypothetical protein
MGGVGTLVVPFAGRRVLSPAFAKGLSRILQPMLLT